MITKHEEVTRVMSLEKDVLELQKLFDALIEEASRNDKKLKKFQAFELELMNARSLHNLVEILLKESQAKFSWDFITLTLVDPEYEIRRLLERSGMVLSELPELNFIDNSEDLENTYHQQLFPVLEPYDEKQHAIFFPASTKKSNHICLLPLSRGHHLIGSYNIGKQSDEPSRGHLATDFLQHLAAIISVSLEISISKERLEYLGLIDPLTGVNNRRFFDQRLSEEISSVIRDNAEISCLFIDIDHFKKVNDNYGHQSGDIILKEVAQIIRELLRATDVVARYGGEEFTVLLSHKGKPKAMEIAERIRQTIERQTFTVADGETISVTTSIGVNTLIADGHEGDLDTVAATFVERADRALYQAKNNGRNRVIYCAGN